MFKNDLNTVRFCIVLFMVLVSVPASGTLMLSSG